MSFESSLDKFERDLDRKAKALSGPVSLKTLFPQEFMRKYTKFESLETLIETYDSDITNETFQESLTPEFDKFVAENSQFTSWQEMYKKAGEEYVVKNLKF